MVPIWICMCGSILVFENDWKIVILPSGDVSIQLNTDNEPYWTRFYWSDDKILLGSKTDPPKRAHTVRLEEIKMCMYL